MCIDYKRPHNYSFGIIIINDFNVFLVVRFLHFDAISECKYKKKKLMFEDIIMIIFQNIGNRLVY